MTASGASARSIRAGALVACAIGVLLAGCGRSEAGPQPDGDSSSRPAASSPGNAGAEPANGPVVENSRASYRVPRGYEVGHELAGTIPANAGGTDRSSITLGEVPAFGTTDPGTAARVVARNVTDGRPPRRMADATLDGEAVFHLEGRPARGSWFSAYGAIRQDTVVYVRFDLEGTRAQSKEVVESVLATWQWK